MDLKYLVLGERISRLKMLHTALYNSIYIIVERKSIGIGNISERLPGTWDRERGSL